MDAPQNSFSKIKDKLSQMRREAEERDAKRRGEKTGFPYADLSTTSINIEALALIPEEEARKAKLAATEFKEKKVALVVYDSENAETKKTIERLKAEGYKLSVFTASLSGLNHIWDFYKFVSKKQENITGRIKIEEKKLLELKDKLVSLKSISDAIGEFNEKPGYTGEIVEIVLAGALSMRASDIHFEPSQHSARIRLRIDGLLYDAFSQLKLKAHESLVSRIKLLSKLKINVNDQAQDGRFTIAFSNKEIEIRTSINPSEFGETIVLRILNPDAIHVSLPQLGFRKDDLEIVERELGKPNGMILNTGPTGSGKTTTLYAFLQHTQKPESKTITIEDPIEYHLEGIEQTQVEPGAGYTFSSGLRSLLRQDPDMILIGEIRDLETAEIAIHASLTGHLVFSTLHTNDAAGAIPRMIDLGVKTSVLAPAVNLIIAQRLIRKLCENCKVEKKLDAEMEEKIKKFIDKLPDKIDKDFYKSNIKIFEPKGCDKCNNLGYKGRIGVFELLIVDGDMELLVGKDPTEIGIKELAEKKGMVLMQEDGILKVISGITSFDEVEKATGTLEF
ncbi:MAG: GspE/PulE family protein [Candidatus Paceibacterota bacterium]